MIAWRIAWRELRHNSRFAIFFALNLSLGLLGFVLLDSFKTALDESLASRSKVLLSADLAVSARRPLTSDEEKRIHEILPSGAREGKMIEMYSMVSAGSSSRLAEINAIDSSYPFYGEIDLEKSGAMTGASPKASLISSPVAWIEPDLALQLGIHSGEILKLGDSELRVADQISNDSGQVWRGFSLASRVYIGLSTLESTHLLRKGSTAYWSDLFMLPRDADVDALARKLNTVLIDPAIQVRTHKNASEEVGRLLSYLNDDLGLVAVVALFLAAIGAAYLFRSFFSRRTREIAVLTSLGVSHRLARRIYMIELGALGALATLVTCAISFVALPALGRLASPYLPYTIIPALSPRTFVTALFLGTFGSILICYPILLKLRSLKPSALFQESVQPTAGFSKREALGWAPGIIALAALSVWQSHSIRIGSIFFSAFIVSLVLIGLFGVGLLSLLGGFEQSFPFRTKMALRNLTRSKLGSVSCFVAIGIGTLLLNLIPSIQAALDTELKSPTEGQTPSLFLYDIQQEQLEPLKALLQENAVIPQGVSPLIRSRLIKINGFPFEKKAAQGSFATREEQQEARSRNRGYNLSYRSELTNAEKIAAGHPFSHPRFDPSVQKLPEITLERRFAERLKIHLGDLLDFDVEGIPVSAEVVGFRKVRWTSFQPNFFIVFQPGVLEEAPKTFLASLPEMSRDQKTSLQSKIVKQFPNVSMIDVGTLVQKILLVFDQMSVALSVMAWLSLFAGFVVLFSIASHQAALRSQENNLLKVLGARWRDVLVIVLIEFSLLGLTAAFVGAALNYAVSFAITEFLFDGSWIFTWKTPLLSIVAVSILSAVIAAVAAARTFIQKPVLLLQERS